MYSCSLTNTFANSSNRGPESFSVKRSAKVLASGVHLTTISFVLFQFLKNILSDVDKRLRRLFAQLAGIDVDVDAALQAGITPSPSPRTTATTGRRVTVVTVRLGAQWRWTFGDQDTGDHINGPESPPEGK